MREAPKDPYLHSLVESPRLSTRGGEGVKIGQNLVHVVVEGQLQKGESFIVNLHKKMRSKES